MEDFEIVTTYYEAVHEKEPAGNKRGDYVFQPPANYGKRPFEFVDMSYSAAKKELKRVAKWGGAFVLLP